VAVKLYPYDHVRVNKSYIFGLTCVPTADVVPSLADVTCNCTRIGINPPTADDARRGRHDSQDTQNITSVTRIKITDNDAQISTNVLNKTLIANSTRVLKYHNNPRQRRNII